MSATLATIVSVPDLAAFKSLLFAALMVMAIFAVAATRQRRP